MSPDPRAQKFVARTVLLGVLAFATLGPGTAVAGTLDQYSTSGSGNSGGIGSADTIAGPQIQLATLSQGQIFTDGIDGALDQAELYLRRDCADPGDALSVQIRTVSGSPALPTSTVLAAATLPAASVPLSNPDWVTVQFSTPATVSAGTLYALVATSDGHCSPATDERPPGYHWGGTDLDFYPGGTWVSSGFPSASWGARSGDLAFKTYVVPDLDTDPGTGTGTGTGSGTTTTATGQRAAALKKCKKKKDQAAKKCRKKARKLPV